MISDKDWKDDYGVLFPASTVCTLIHKSIKLLLRNAFDDKPTLVQLRFHVKQAAIT